MRFAIKSTMLTRDAHFQDKRSVVGRRPDGSPHVRLFGEDMTLLRRKVFKRDGGACVDCGSRYWLQLSHNHPRGSGGDDTEENTAVRCIKCHRKLDGHGEPLHF